MEIFHHSSRLITESIYENEEVVGLVRYILVLQHEENYQLTRQLFEEQDLLLEPTETNLALFKKTLLTELLAYTPPEFTLVATSLCCCLFGYLGQFDPHLLPPSLLEYYEASISADQWLTWARSDLRKIPKEVRAQYEALINQVLLFIQQGDFQQAKNCIHQAYDELAEL